MKEKYTQANEVISDLVSERLSLIRRIREIDQLIDSIRGRQWSEPTVYTHRNHQHHQPGFKQFVQKEK